MRNHDIFPILEYNVVNTHLVKQYINKIIENSKSPNINEWANTVLYNFIINSPDFNKEVKYDEIQNPPMWVPDAIARGDVIHQFNPPLEWEAKLHHIIDYFNWLHDNNDPVISNVDRLKKITIPQADNKARIWSMGSKKKTKLNVGDITVVRKDGEYTWVKPETKQSMMRDGSIMQNCLGQGTYWDEVDSGKQYVLFLHDPKNNPHIAIRFSDDNLYEIKGKQNNPPVGEYVPYAVRFLDFLHKKGVSTYCTDTNNMNLVNQDGKHISKLLTYATKYSDKGYEILSQDDSVYFVVKSDQKDVEIGRFRLDTNMFISNTPIREDGLEIVKSYVNDINSNSQGTRYLNPDRTNINLYYDTTAKKYGVTPIEFAEVPYKDDRGIIYTYSKNIEVRYDNEIIALGYINNDSVGSLERGRKKSSLSEDEIKFLNNSGLNFRIAGSGRQINLYRTIMKDDTKGWGILNDISPNRFVKNDTVVLNIKINGEYLSHTTFSLTTGELDYEINDKLFKGESTEKTEEFLTNFPYFIKRFSNYVQPFNGLIITKDGFHKVWDVMQPVHKFSNNISLSKYDSYYFIHENKNILSTFDLHRDDNSTYVSFVKKAYPNEWLWFANNVLEKNDGIAKYLYGLGIYFDKRSDQFKLLQDAKMVYECEFGRVHMLRNTMIFVVNDQVVFIGKKDYRDLLDISERIELSSDKSADDAVKLLKKYLEDNKIEIQKTYPLTSLLDKSSYSLIGDNIIHLDDHHPNRDIIKLGNYTWKTVSKNSNFHTKHPNLRVYILEDENKETVMEVRSGSREITYFSSKFSDSSRKDSLNSIIGLKDEAKEVLNKLMEKENLSLPLNISMKYGYFLKKGKMTKIKEGSMLANVIEGKIEFDDGIYFQRDYDDWKLFDTNIESDYIHDKELMRVTFDKEGDIDKVEYKKSAKKKPGVYIHHLKTLIDAIHELSGE